MNPRNGLRLSAAHEWVAHDPFGSVKPGDAPPPDATGDHGRLVLRAARGAYASFRALVHGAGAFGLSVETGGGLQVDLYKAWYHRMTPPRPIGPTR